MRSLLVASWLALSLVAFAPAGEARFHVTACAGACVALPFLPPDPCDELLPPDPCRLVPYACLGTPPGDTSIVVQLCRAPP